MKKSFPAKGKGAGNAGKFVRKAVDKPGIRNRKLEKHFNLKPILTSTSETSTTDTSGVSSGKTTSRSDSETSGSETSGSETSGSDSTRFSPHSSKNDEHVSKMKKPMAILCFISNNLLKNLGDNDDKKVEEEDEIEEAESEEEDYSSDTSNTSRASSPETSDSDSSGETSEVSQRSPSPKTSSAHGKCRVRSGSSSSRKQHQTGNDIRYTPKVISKCQGHINVSKSKANALVASLDLQAGGDSQKQTNKKHISHTEEVKDGTQRYIRRGSRDGAGGSRSSCSRKKVSFSVDDGVEEEIEEMISPAHEEKMLHFTSKFDGEGRDRHKGRVTKRFVFTKVR